MFGQADHQADLALSDDNHPNILLVWQIWFLNLYPRDQQMSLPLLDAFDTARYN